MNRRNEKKDKDSGLYKELEFVYDYDLDKENRTVFFHGDVDEALVDRTIKSLLYLDQQGDKPINMYICSYGGSVDHMFSLYDVITGVVKSPVNTIGTGCICSAAVLLLACGEERVATENSWLMAHKAQGGAFGNAEEVMSGAQAFMQYEMRRYKLLARHSLWTAKEWQDHELKSGEVWMQPQDMLKAGVVDKIARPRRARSVKSATKKGTVPRKKIEKAVKKAKSENSKR